MFEYTNGRPSSKYISTSDGWSSSNSLELWTRGIDQQTQGVEWHLDGAGRGFEYLYDTLGRRERTSTWVDEITESGAHWTEVVVDGLGRPVSVTQPDGSLVTTEYAGNRVTEVTRKVATSTVGESDVVTRSVTDPLGRVRRVVEDASGGSYTLDHSYDVADRLTRVWDPGLGKEVARFQYSPGGYLLEAWDRDRRTVFDGYNDLGSVTRETTDTGGFADPLSSAPETVLGYDPVGRLATKTVGSDQVLTMTYGWNDADPSYGKPLTAAQVNEHDGADVTVTQAWSYDGPGGSVSGRATTVTSVPSTRFDLAYGHDQWGNLSRVVAPDGAVTTSFFDGGWLTSASWVGAGTGLTDFTYLANGRVRRQHLGSYMSLLETEDASGMARPGAIVLKQGGSPLWLGESYSFDGSGNLKAAGSKQYAYDGLGRLTMRQPGSTEDFVFDRWGNLLSLPKAGGGSVTLDPEDDSNRLSKVNNGVDSMPRVSFLTTLQRRLGDPGRCHLCSTRHVHRSAPCHPLADAKPTGDSVGYAQAERSESRGENGSEASGRRRC